MAISQQLSTVAPYARRLLDDDYVQDEFDRLFANVRDGSRRLRRQGPAEAVTDPQLRTKVTAAIAAAVHIARALNEPEPPPKRHRVRRTVLAVAVGGAAVAGYRQLTAGGSVQRDG
jgi:hypothetical protein